ncbi:hypothetical protein [Chitinophaga sp. S165]|uniref:hypothetical protein n=1 Tax=Chitinophaga sp. S165 TaxID=2135462 RepID=UPI000D719E5A|nr:hypothetical protein [Chitinophaga sp. S165]
MENSPAQLEQFFDNWSAETPLVSDSALGCLNDTIQNVHLVYRSFYNPTDTNKTGGAKWVTAAYSKVKYLLLQDEISYGFVKTLDKETVLQNRLKQFAKGDTARLRTLLDQYKGKKRRLEMDFLHWPGANHYTQLTGFRPQLEIDKPIAVVLTADYEHLLNAFLGSKRYKPGTGSIMLPAESERESRRRKAFLENDIKIWSGQWDFYWQFASLPHVDRITFDENFEHAVVDYRMDYEGGYGYLKKVNGAWEVIEVRSVWIR